MSLTAIVIDIFLFPVALRPNVGQGLLILKVSRSNTTMHHSRQDSSRRVISSSHKPLLDNTQHSQQTNIHAPGGIRTHDLSRRAVADLRLRLRGHWDRQIDILVLNTKRLNNTHSSQTSEALKMKAISSFETQGSTHPAAQRHIPEERYFLLHRCESLQNFGKWEALGSTQVQRNTDRPTDRQITHIHKQARR